jgi:predicted branched-subunit amino acid permease
VDHSERPGSISVYDYRDKSIQHAWIATLGYAAATTFGTFIAILQGARDFLVIGTVVIQLMIILFLAFWISRKSRVAAVLMLTYVIGLQLYVWLGMHSFSGTIVSVIVTGFLLRGTKRIFEEHNQRKTDRISDKKSDAA